MMEHSSEPSNPMSRQKSRWTCVPQSENFTAVFLLIRSSDKTTTRLSAEVRLAITTNIPNHRRCILENLYITSLSRRFLHQKSLLYFPRIVSTFDAFPPLQFFPQIWLLSNLFFEDLLLPSPSWLSLRYWSSEISCCVSNWANTENREPPINTSCWSENCFRFGDEEARSLVQIELSHHTPPNVPKIMVLMDNVPVNIPALVSLDLLDAEQFYVDKVTNRLVHRKVITRSDDYFQNAVQWSISIIRHDNHRYSKMCYPPSRFYSTAQI